MGISIWQLLIVLVIVLLLFGTRKLRNLGSDLGGAIRGFKEALSGADEADTEEPKPAGRIDAEKKVEPSAGGGVQEERPEKPERESL